MAKTRPRETWEEFYCREVAGLLNLPVAWVQVVQRHDHACARDNDGKVIMTTFVCELLCTQPDGTTITVFGWDVPPFVAYKKMGALQTPDDALLAFVAERLKRQRDRGGS